MKPPEGIDNQDVVHSLALAPMEPLAVDSGQAARLLGLSRSMFYKIAEAGYIGPMGRRLGKKCVRYSVAELRAWAAAGMPPRHEWERIKAEKNN